MEIHFSLGDGFWRGQTTYLLLLGHNTVNILLTRTFSLSHSILLISIKAPTKLPNLWNPSHTSPPPRHPGRSIWPLIGLEQLSREAPTAAVNTPIWTHKSTREHRCYILTLPYTRSSPHPSAVIKHTLPSIHKTLRRLALIPTSPPPHTPFPFDRAALNQHATSAAFTSPLEAVKRLLLHTLGLNKAIFLDLIEQNG